MGGNTAMYGPLAAVLWGVVPYVAMVLFFVVTVQRYRQQSFTYSSLSSQFLENRQHFWGMVPFHYGLLVVLLGHVVAFLVPRSVLWWNARPARLYILELSALILGMVALLGLANLVVRRLGNARLRPVTSTADWILYVLLLAQVTTGVLIAILYPWGSSWFASVLSPYLWSLVQLNPAIGYVTPLPFLVKAHILGNFLLIAFFPFTRLVHILVVPNMYLWRRPQVVRWNMDPKTCRVVPGTTPEGGAPSHG
ncbi:MAG: respiratory nitrate reductase subunit gamma [Planctomycetota bacterium]